MTPVKTINQEKVASRSLDSTKNEREGLQHANGLETETGSQDNWPQ